MKEPSATAANVAKMDQARKLMEKGQYRESLVLALELLLQELNTLRDSLLALQMATQLESAEPPAAPVREEPPQPEFYWLPPVKARVLH